MNDDGQPDLRLHPIHEFSKWCASMKRKSLISKWNQNKTRYLYLKTNCNYLNATRGLHIKPKKQSAQEVQK
jgi:GntR family transcriptional regulator/MocR family aminotransferase